MTDFFFGKITDNKGYSRIGLNDLIRTQKKIISREHFTKQINRLLLSSKDNLIISDDGTSYPSFNELINRLLLTEIVSIEIESRTDINPSTEATLACKIFFENGLIWVRPHWCGYKEMRADEIISTLLLPIYLNGLAQKVVIKDVNDDALLSNVTKEAIQQIFSLAKYPKQERLKRYEDYINIAVEIFNQGLTGTDAFTEYDKQVRLNS
tara:strand:- start:41 stop:667 length:627 start_codon:yes stop_codon:yes gene_type:complete